MHGFGQALNAVAAVTAKISTAIGNLEFNAPSGHLFADFLPKRTFKYQLLARAPVLIDITHRTRCYLQLSCSAYFGVSPEQHGKEC